MSYKRSYLFLVFSFLGALFVSSCSSDSGGSSSASTPPVPYCSTVTSYDDAITISGTARYEFRTNGNGAIGTPNPIRHAEVRVTNVEGAILQCGETEANGTFSLNLPNNNVGVTITVASRADNQYMQVYVLNNPTNNAFHSVSTTTILDETKNIGTLTARADGTLEGGAFNILDKILDANDWLRDETADCGTTYSCTTFSVGPLVTAYWSAGVNPSAYFGLSSPLSFFIPENNQLYILGGSNGNVDSSDTDHFDDTIIIHEYGHFIEQNYASADSPGGTHQGDNILDPRLAWGEAFANFFQAEVTQIKVYRDTFGTPDGNSGVFVNEDLENGSSDTPSVAEEGNFREFSITRALIDYVDANNEGANDNLTAPFEEIWTLMTSTSQGFNESSRAFRAVGLLNTLQAVLPSGTAWGTIQNAERQLVGLENYGNTLSAGTGCPVTIQAENVPNASTGNDPGRQPEDGSPANSNQFKSNDFYRIDHSGGSLTIQMSYSTNPLDAADLDIYLYEEEYVFGVASTVVGFSDDTIPNGASSDTETISLTNVPAGVYMLNVNYSTLNGIKDSASYNLSVNSTSVCPD